MLPSRTKTAPESVCMAAHSIGMLFQKNGPIRRITIGEREQRTPVNLGEPKRAEQWLYQGEDGCQKQRSCYTRVHHQQKVPERRVHAGRGPIRWAEVGDPPGSVVCMKQHGQKGEEHHAEEE